MDADLQKNLILLVLQRLPDTAAATLQKLYVKYNNISNILNTDYNELANILDRKALNIFEECRNKKLKSKAWQQAQKDFEQICKKNIRILSIEDNDYPAQLKEIHYAPPILMVEGNLAALQKNQIGIIGSRNASPTGLENAQKFGRDLAEVGMVITSGMALGIDAAAHRGALSIDKELNETSTIAVIATGIDLCYPSRNASLAEKIKEQGAIISEFPLGTSPKKENFPRRNRIISGLAKGVLVIEAELQSGSLITARYAIEQNREVFAIPGSIQNPASRGCHQLIREGAKLVECIEDILSELEHPFGQIKMKFNNIDIEHKRTDCGRDQLTDVEKMLIAYIDENPVPVDQITRRALMPVEKVTALLLSMELNGWVENTGFGYRRTHRLQGFTAE